MVSIQAVIVARYEQERSWEEMKVACGSGGAAALRTMQRWCRSMGEQAPEWLGSIERYLAVQDSASSWLDAHGRSAQASNEAQDLFNDYIVAALRYSTSSVKEGYHFLNSKMIMLVFLH